MPRRGDRHARREARRAGLVTDAVTREAARMKVGVLALQGAFREHAEALDALGADVDARQDARAARRASTRSSCPAASRPRWTSCSTRRACARRCATRSATACRRLATCAGLIVLAAEVVDGRADQQPLGVLDVTVRRNGYGRQRESFEADARRSRARRRRRSRACSSGRPWSSASGPASRCSPSYDGVAGARAPRRASGSRRFIPSSRAISVSISSSSKR